MYLASADFMTRNLDRRVEVVFPINDPGVHQEIRTVIDLQLKDNTKARIIDAKQQNAFVHRASGEPAVRAQVDTYRHFASMIPQDLEA